jgi:hypothetical protein
MLAPVLVLLGLAVLFRALPQGAKERVTSTASLAGANALIVVAGLLTVLLRGTGSGEDERARSAPVDESGVCARADVHPRCTALLVAASGVLETMDATPRITIPGRGDLVLAATTTLAGTALAVRENLVDAFRVSGWTPVGSATGDLLSYRRGTFTAACSLRPDPRGTTVVLSVSE